MKSHCQVCKMKLFDQIIHYICSPFDKKDYLLLWINSYKIFDIERYLSLIPHCKDIGLDFNLFHIVKWDQYNFICIISLFTFTFVQLKYVGITI